MKSPSKKDEIFDGSSLAELNKEHLLFHWNYAEKVGQRFDKVKDEIAKITRQLGLLEQVFISFKKEMENKTEAFQSTAKLSLQLGTESKEKFREVKTMIVDCLEITHSAQKTVADMDAKVVDFETRIDRKRDEFMDSFSRVGWRLLWTVLGVVFSGAILLKLIL